MSKSKNTNCLEGLQCSVCESLSPFDIVAKALFHRVSDNGTDEYSSVAWEGDSPCTCCECGHHGMVSDFRVKGGAPVLKQFSVLLQYPDWLQPSDGLETYYEHVSAVDAQDAVVLVQQAAAAVNRSYGVKPKDFTPVIVLAGHCEAEAYNDSLKG